jgi:hypothetical protein
VNAGLYIRTEEVIEEGGMGAGGCGIGGTVEMCLRKREVANGSEIGAARWDTLRGCVSRAVGQVRYAGRIPWYRLREG